MKINHTPQRRRYYLSPTSHYRAGSEFEEFVMRYRAKHPLKVEYYLYRETVERHSGTLPLKVVDANEFDGKEYRQYRVCVDELLHQKVRANPLFVRTLDTGALEGRAGLYLIPEVFHADGILVSRVPYRTHPIQVFLEPTLPPEDTLLLKNYFNLLLEHFRQLTDSEFMTTYKYSESAYTRKYLGLSQVKALIETFPYLDMSPAQREVLRQAVKMQDVEKVIRLLKIQTPGGNLCLGFEGTCLASGGDVPPTMECFKAVPSPKKTKPILGGQGGTMPGKGSKVSSSPLLPRGGATLNRSL